VKVIRENWQFPEEYLREKREKGRKEEEKQTTGVLEGKAQ